MGPKPIEAPSGYNGRQLSILLHAVHPGAMKMTGFRGGLRPRVLIHYSGDRCSIHVISCSDAEHEVIGFLVDRNRTAGQCHHSERGSRMLSL